MSPALSIQAVSKQYTDNKQVVDALKGVSFDVPAGKIFGLLGPNGAGKSTLINLITGSLKPSDGRIELFGTDVVTDPLAAKRMLGLVPQELVVEPAFTVKEVLYYFAGMNGVPASERKAKIEKALEQLDLTEKMNHKARLLSGGQKRRVMIAKAMLHQPKFLILDEPTAGVDIKLRSTIWDLVTELNKAGTTILFTTHYLEEAEQLCEELAIIDHGRLIKRGRTADIQTEFEQSVIYFELFDQSAPEMNGVKRLASEWEYETDNLNAGICALTKHYGDNLKSIRSEKASLEKIFLSLTGEKHD